MVVTAGTWTSLKNDGLSRSFALSGSLGELLGAGGKVLTTCPQLRCNPMKRTINTNTMQDNKWDCAFRGSW